MKKTILILLLIVIATIGSNAQRINIRGALNGHIYSQEGKELSTRQITRIVHSNKVAYEIIKSAKKYNSFSQLVGVGGLAIMAYPLITASSGHDFPDWRIIAVGAGIAALSLPIMKITNEKLYKGVNLYNEDFPEEEIIMSNFNPQFNFIVNAKGIGFSIQF